MSQNVSFYRCPVCGNIIGLIEGNAEHIMCCGKPMEKDHYIEWIAQVSENRTTRVRLYPEQSTETRFPYIPRSTIYAYCNKHGLWMKEV